ncbi:TonB-dependent siderophore receptor [Achromobacter xylosoxidans]|uniref:TonB-dependent siderophore receptor n=1 Tax=Alcaligenes xylosoxydans xylosoxydans TaxID=85698 RepID=A0A1R1JLE9_ALCXX|nr:TonB-dependent siderophore receptor [Achromobacter xylosoxidans]OMG77974.1 hypothetical protein BIZ92_16320 [Achromobacter xylosoxidans]BEG76005.1 Ferrichrome outer membrane transporter/phage receptor [Achromobacter xylosoxidans]
MYPRRLRRSLAGLSLLLQTVAHAAGEAPIPAGPLDDALGAYAQRHGLVISYDAALTRGLRSPGLTAPTGTDSDLSGLLQGTGLSARRNAEGRLQVFRTPTPGAVELAPITVPGLRESAFGPVDGLVATRSASGSKTDAALLETPQTINVISRAEMDRRPVRSTAEALAYTPGVNAAWAGYDVRFDVIQLRGFNANYATYQDGLRTATGEYVIPRLNPYGAERIEVLKGPASVLYGQNTPGGLVNYVTKAPPDARQGEIQVEGGNNGHKQGAFDLGGPLNEAATLRYRLTGLYRDADASLDHVSETNRYFAPAFTWAPNADTSFTLRLQYQRDRVDGWTGYFLPAEGTLYANPNGGLKRSRFPGEPGVDRWDVEQRSVGYRLDHRLDSTWKVSQNLRYAEIDFSARNSFLNGFLDADKRLVDRSYVGWREQVYAFTVDNQAQAEFDTGPLSHTVLAGLDLRRTNNGYRFYMGSLGPLDLYRPVYGQRPQDIAEYTNTRTRATQIGYYLQDQIRAGQWAFSGGVRHDRAWNRKQGINFGSDAANGQDDTAWTGRAGVVYLARNGLAPYVSYSTSFDPAIGATRSGTPFKPTKGEQYEAGIKYEPPGQKALITLSVFQLTQKNVIATDPTNPAFSVQTGEARVRGLELEGKAELGGGWSVIASYGYSQGEVTRNTPDALGVNTEGNALQNLPRHQAALWAEHRFGGIAQGLSAGLGVRYRGSTYGDANNTLAMKPVTLVDARLAYDLGALDPSLKGLAVALSATNLFDRRYVASCGSATSCYWGQERQVYGTLSYRW